MKNIYHTHTLHSNLKVKEIIKKAIQADCETIGFVNIGPSRFGKDNTGFSTASEMIEWVSQMKKVKEEYKNKITVMCGIEMNFLDRFTGEVDEAMIKKVAGLDGVDYILFAHHFYPGQEHLEDIQIDDDCRVAIKHSMDEMHKHYPVKYICHPSLFLRGHRKWDKFAEQMAYDIVNFAKKNDAVLELPFDTFTIPDSDLHYQFWKIVADAGVKVHLDLDVQMIDFFTREGAKIAEDNAKNWGLNLVDKVF